MNPKNPPRRLIFITLLLYILLTIGLSYLGAKIVSDLERKEFEGRFEIYAHDIVENSFHAAAQSFSALRSLGKSITAHAEYGRHEGGFPFVALPYWKERTEEIRRVSLDDMVAFVPLLTLDQVSAWETFSVANQGWVKNDVKVSDLTGVDREQIPPLMHSPAKIYDDIVSFESISEQVASPEQRQYVRAHYANATDSMDDKVAPVWLVGPVPTDTSIINTNLAENDAFRELFMEVIVYRHGLLAPVSMAGLLEHEQADTRETQSALIEPVFETLTKTTARIAGFLVADVPWCSYFRNIIPKGAGDLLVYIEDTCGNTLLSIIVNGPEASFLDLRDVHNPKFDQQMVESSWKSGPGSVVLDQTALKDEMKFNAPSFPHHCEFTVQVYPTDSFEAQYTTSFPVLIASSIAVIMAVLAIFISVCLVLRQQQGKLKTTEKAHAIFSSLFPESIQGRILLESKSQSDVQAPSSLMESAGMIKDAPIADSYPEISIIFADMVGFTKWCSSRDPSQVFFFLERVYGEFDKIALADSIYKVETVGDCYVAVAGIPEPRDDHALAIARFATALVKVFNQCTYQLQELLGSDTKDLGLRIGLHSGPVTAGVLRGSRSRFQIFGTTVNQCSRMETTGMMGQIHVSSTTAYLLHQAGKGSCLVPREDKVVAKGIGLIDSYWYEEALSHHDSSRQHESFAEVDC